MLLAALFVLITRPSNPLEFAQQAKPQFGPKGPTVDIRVKPGGVPGSFQIVCELGKVHIVGADSSGAMYGTQELNERIKRLGTKAQTENYTGTPYLQDRGLNLFLTLPWDYKKNDTDYEPAALVDPNRWWFQNDDYWTTLLDLMAKSRLNWLDIHGGWDISVTNAPNLYAYFVTSKTFPKVGVSDEIKASCLQRLNHVIDMAHARGIRVSLMAYEANLKIPQNPNPPYQATEANIYTYTKEVVEQMIRRAPGLDAIGYRIGESGKSESFFKCYGEAVKASGRDIPLITRSWITTKRNVLPLARAAKDFTVEIKYNGEQWGAPYQVAGGRMADWHSYSFEDYLSDSGHADQNAKTWPGQPAEGGGQWPSEPYKIVWQVRANGTHRIFPHYDPEWVRRSILAMKMGTASGYTIEGEDAYYPKSPDYYLANPADKYCNWIHQRDEMYWMSWGRLGYDPHTPDAVFDARAEELLGKDSKPLVEAWKTASRFLPINFMAYANGPDHRDHAPELEWGIDTNSLVHGQGLDPFVFSPIDEELANHATGGIDGRLSVTAANDSHSAVAIVEFARPFLSSSDLRACELGFALTLESQLAIYNRERFASAFALAILESDGGTDSANPEVLRMSNAERAYRVLAANPFYRPFTERLRMHTNTFGWKDELKKVSAEADRVRQFPVQKDPVKMWPPDVSPPFDGHLSWTTQGDQVVAHLKVKSASRAWLLVKPLPSSTFFHRIPMQQVVGDFQAVIPREKWGQAVAAEASGAAGTVRVPEALKERPYLIVPAFPGDTPYIYAADEAMNFLKPASIKPENYSVMLLGTRAWQWFSSYNRATHRKLLDPVERGMKLIILQQDFNKYKLDWLPVPPRFEGGSWNEFDPAGALGLDKVVASQIMYQRFLPTDGWKVYGNGGIASYKLGKGEIWITSARVMQWMHKPDAAKAFVHFLSLGGKTKPTVLVDSGSEGAQFSSSCHADLMNSHDIPFVTLGELVAQEQGMDSMTPIPGPVANDDLLDGKGTAMANAWLKAEVERLAKRPTAPNLTEFEKLRRERKKELMRSLGLDPMPPKTPLHARITGKIQRPGYTIEKLVFESRPKFYVTCYVYKADNAPTGKLPVVVNVNGHWAHKKGEDRLQLRCAFQALHGYLAIAVDTPGWSFEGKSLIERRPEGDHNDFKLVQGGSNTTGYYVWDTIRALDYISTRPDADMDRVGLTGASGGGLGTLYTFAADDRYKAAVPVVYMASMELAPDNGCLCNHVPGTCQIGDRSDVIGIQAPKPVYLMGAQNDGEFPPAATLLTFRKMQETWDLFPGGKAGVYAQIFAGGHDYNQPMREAMIGFFDRYVRGVGDGSPVPQPKIDVFDPEDKQYLVLDPPIPGERTMRDLSKEYLYNSHRTASAKDAIALNGGIPARSNLNLHESGTDDKRTIVFESEPGLKTPGILRLPKGAIKGVRIMVSDSGKAFELAHASEPTDGFAVLYLDTLGVGELEGIELRYLIYLGRSVAFTGGWQIVRAAEAMRSYSKNIEIVGNGTLSSQAAMYAGLMGPTFSKVTGNRCLANWVDALDAGVPDSAIQPRAHLLGPLEELRKLVRNSDWHVRVL